MINAAAFERSDYMYRIKQSNKKVCLRELAARHPYLWTAVAVVGMPAAVLAGVTAATAIILFPAACLFGWPL
ncbi:hypothetical protein MUJ63_09920 [Lachnospiraceae bacterium NSJ-143]|nr:hypothetical protein [Lachnospiraceae bacterium NSJ-143]